MTGSLSSASSVSHATGRGSRGGPLGEDRCLAVARRGDQRNDRRSGGASRVETTRSRSTAPARSPGDSSLASSSGQAGGRCSTRADVRRRPRSGPVAKDRSGRSMGLTPPRLPDRNAAAKPGRRSRGSRGQERDQVGGRSPMSIDRASSLLPRSGPGDEPGREAQCRGHRARQPRFRSDHGIAATRPRSRRRHPHPIRRMRRGAVPRLAQFGSRRGRAHA